MGIRRWVALFLTGCWLGSAFGAGVSGEEAQRAVAGWLRLRAALGCRLGSGPESVETYPGRDGVGTFHVVRLKEGGFVVTSADRRLAPVLAFSGDGEWTASDADPFWALMTGDIADRTRALNAGGRTLAAAGSNANEARWVRLLSDGPVTAGAGLDSLSDVRIAPLLGSKWNQQTHNNYVNGSYCFNYYTPSNYPCGCVATAGSQIMRYHQYPTQPVTSGTYTCEVDYEEVRLTMKGGTYAWEDMPLITSSPRPTEAQCQAIGKLTYDVGVACLMSYTPHGSAAPGYLLAKRLTERFGYANAISAVFYDEGYPYTTEWMTRAILPNLDARLPVMLSVHSEVYGHAVVADGYGYSDGDLYLHINMGWGGVTDAWYAPPDIDEYTSIDAIVYNVYPTQTANGTIVSGRVLDAEGTPVSGMPVSALTSSGGVAASMETDGKGIYAFILPAASYTIRTGRDGYFAQQTVKVSACKGSRITDDGAYYLMPATISNLYGVDLTLPSALTVAMPTCTPMSGTISFDDSILVTLACGTDGAEIHYTLDGSEPTTASSRYEAPIRLTATTTLKARAFRSDYNPSDILTATFTFPPRHDYFEDAKSISGTNGTETVNIDGFTLETGEPLHRSHYNQFRSVWFRWFSPGNGSVTFLGGCKRVTTSGNTISTVIIPTYLSVYTGTAVNRLTRVKEGTYSSTDRTSSATFNATAGTVYYIAVATGSETVGDVTMSWATAKSFAPAYTITTEIPVPYAWLSGKGVVTGNDYEAAAKADTDGDGFDNWEEYLCDSDPKDPASYLRMTGITVRDGVGVPAYLPSASPYGSFILEGTDSLTLPLWAPAGASHRFFRVRVVPK